MTLLSRWLSLTLLDPPSSVSSLLCRGILLHEAVFLVHYHCRINSNEQQYLPYPICSKRWLLHLFGGLLSSPEPDISAINTVPPTASVPLAPVDTDSYFLSSASGSPLLSNCWETSTGASYAQRKSKQKSVSYADQIVVQKIGVVRKT
ncbi:hypothetical protein GW17_00044515 [Ensete ventricosum]|nr:hypothetical protein GW17_00044515 [Ensete ventricosum]